MKKAILLLLALLCTLSLMACEPIDDMLGDEPMVEKPVIYLYPTEELESETIYLRDVVVDEDGSFTVDCGVELAGSMAKASD